MISPGSPEAVAMYPLSRKPDTYSTDIPKLWIEKYLNPENVIQSVRDGLETPSVELFVNKMKPGDELALFTSPDYSWEDKLGSRGFIQLRNGAQVDSLTLSNLV